MRPSLRRISWNYSLVHALFWPAMCPIACFASVYLLSKGFTNGQIGLLLGLSNGLVVLLQPTLAAIADRNGKYNLSRIILTVIGVMALALIGLIFCGDNLLLIAFLFLLGTAGTWVLSPLINALCVWFVNRGLPINFGLARGMGGLAFAVMSSVLGKVVAATSTDILPVISLFFFLAAAVSVYAMRISKYSGLQAEVTASEMPLQGSSVSFLQRYRLFCASLMGWSLIFIFFRVMDSYLFQILGAVGGDSANLGICFSIAAIAEMVTTSSYKHLRRRIPDRTLMRFSAGAFVAQSAVLLLAPNVLVVYLSMGMQMFSSGIYYSASVYYANGIMEDRDKSKGQAMMTVVDAFAAICAGLLGGLLLSVASVRTLLFTSLIIASVGAVVVLTATGAMRKKEQTIPPPPGLALTADGTARKEG